MFRFSAILALLALHLPVTVRAQDDTDATTAATVDLGNLESPTEVEQRLRRALKDGVDLTHVVQNGTVYRDSFTLQSGDSVIGNILLVNGAALIHGKVIGNLIALDGRVTMYPDGSVSGTVLTFNGEVRTQGNQVGGPVVRIFGRPAASIEESEHHSRLEHSLWRLIGAISMFVTLLVIGISLVVFARSKFAVVADTVAHSFGRSFLVGLIGQSMLLPTFGIVIVGLILSVVGILLLPFVIVAYILMALLGLAGGYLAVAYVLGKSYARRHLPPDAAPEQLSFRTVVFGLAILFSPWIARALFGWVPVLGSLIWALAFFATWILMTAGFGAVLLSRGGTRTTFAGGTS
jgi:MFS family permease